MKYLFISLTIVCSSLQLAIAKGERQLKGLTQTEKTHVYLYQHFGPKAFLLDSASVKKGKFAFNLDDQLPHGVYKIGYDETTALSVLLEEKSLDIMLVDSFYVENSPENDDFQKYLTQNEQYKNDLRELEQHFQKIYPLQKTNPEVFASEFEKIKSSLVQMNVTQASVYTNLAKTSTSPLLKAMLNLVLAEKDTPKETFFTANDFANDTFVYSDIYERKIQIFFMRYGNLNAQTVEPETQSILNLSVSGSKAREVLYYSLCTIALSTNLDYARALAKNYKKEYPNSPLVPEILQLIPKGPPAIGDEAPELAYPNPEGEILKLSSLKGKVVLLDFWASWCGPCRRESPNVVRAYHKYKDQGFTVFSVSLDADKASWVRAIEQDGLAWPYHVSDLKRWRSEASKTYQVTGIPATFLIDQNGVIIGKNLRGEALQQKLDELFKQ